MILEHTASNGVAPTVAEPEPEVVEEQDAGQAVADLLRRSVDVQLNFVVAHHNVDVDMSKLTWGDMRKMRQLSGKENVSEDEAEQIMSDLVSKVTGQNADDLPSMAVGQIINAIMSGGGGLDPKG